MVIYSPEKIFSSFRKAPAGFFPEIRFREKGNGIPAPFFPGVLDFPARRNIFFQRGGGEGGGGFREQKFCMERMDVMTSEESKIFRGELFSPGDPELKAIKLRAHKKSAEFSRADEDETEKRACILKDLLAEFGEGSFLQGPVFFHYGIHTRIGKRNFFNYNLTIQDDAPVTIGNDNNFGPNVTIVTPVHPMLPGERRFMLDGNGEKKHLCYARGVTIGNDCWFGANVVVCPGVSIGDNCVIGAGSVVTRDIPENSFAAGVPCRVIRKLSEADSMVHKPEILASCRVLPDGG